MADARSTADENVHLRQKRAKRKKDRILLLVENEALAIQLGNVSEKLLPSYRTKVFSGNVHRRDIFVVTAQIFLNALRAKKIESVGDFSLIVVDECHHSNKQHMYNEIMSRYIDLKLRENVDSSQLPQIVGLTSTLGVGGRTEWDQGLNHMKKLMANMDAKFLCTVKTPLTIEELKIFVNSPVEGRDVDWFENAVGEIAKRIDAHMSQHQIVLSASPEDEFIQTKCRLPATFGTEKYMQWNAEFAKNIAQVRSKDIRRVLNPCRLHLEAYNEALMMHCNSKTRYAFAVLEEFMEDFRVVPAKHPTDAFIMALYDDILPVPGRDVDWFTNDVKDIAKRIDDHMAKHQTVRSAPPEDEFIQTKCRLPETFGMEKYLQWSAEFVKHIAKVRSKDIRRVLNPCRLHLEAYNKALMIHRDATKRDAFVSLEDFMEDFRVVPAEHPTDAFIMALYDELREISFNTEPDNPKLLKLKEILTGVLCNEQNARGIIFVRTGELAQALVRWVNETDSLNVLNASEIAEDSLNVLHAAEFVGQSDSASVEDQDYAESLCKYLEDKGYVCIQSGNDYQPLDSHQKSLKDTITITNKTLFIVTANSLQQFTEIIRNVLSRSSGLKDDKISMLLSFMTGSEATQFCNEICELIPFGILQIDVTTVFDIRRFQALVFKRGVTKSGQKDVLEYFKNGQHRLLIATSVAEEGLDISKCNLGGRENSLHYVIAEEGSWVLEKEEKNRHCEELMNPHLQVFIEEHAHIWEKELFKKK
ncbi:DDX58-like protein [Mya arenaria]|uniref:DDX58-like protein n=1 Tax=Mya arenaria TaxID=6604 RepID=A0ABY7G8W1_MYAAR|nr:DDX58-like protein [Mya arenaria]